MLLCLLKVRKEGGKIRKERKRNGRGLEPVPRFFLSFSQCASTRENDQNMKKTFVTDQISIVASINNLIAMVIHTFPCAPPPLKRVSTSQPQLDPLATRDTKYVREGFTFLSPEPTPV